MGDKKKAKKEKKREAKALKKLHKTMLREGHAKGKVKSSCCEKYKKGAAKRCGRCPCFDLAKKVA